MYDKNNITNKLLLGCNNPKSPVTTTAKGIISINNSHHPNSGHILHWSRH